jgi:23S rRNA (uracil1939-C5)-methyltransferase
MKELKIEKLIYGGKCLARDEKGLVYFVPNCLPDELVEVVPIKKKGYYEVELKKIVEKHTERIEPPCEYFTICGGCSYQHIPYDKQLFYKKNILVETLKRMGGLAINICDTIPSDKSFAYRNRAQLKVFKENFGFYKRGSLDVVDIKECLLLKKEINGTIKLIRGFLKNLTVKPSEVHIHSSASEKVWVSFICDEKTDINESAINSFYKQYSDKFIGAGIYKKKHAKLFQKNIFGQPYLFEKVGDITYRVRGGNFFQVNTFQVENLINYIVSYIKDKDFKKVIDFYCGIGTFSVPASRYVENITGIESNKLAVSDAFYNKNFNKVYNVHFINADVENVKSSIRIINKDKPDCILFDPPRAGVGGLLLEKLGTLDYPKSIVYVSCEPPTLARDLKILTDCGFEIKKFAFIDMFPHTFHIEAIVILEKINSTYDCI